jgi:hypothetical protein
VDRPGAPAAGLHGRSCSIWISSESPTYGEQEGSAYNGHFGCTCYHPLFVFNQLGDVEQCALRPGKRTQRRWLARGAGARDRPLPGHCEAPLFRGDVAFANPEIYEFLEAEEISYTIRLPANTILQNRIGHLLKRPIGRPPHEVRWFYASFSYQAQSWNKQRRVVAKVKWHPGELYPRVGFIVSKPRRVAGQSAGAREARPDERIMNTVSPHSCDIRLVD